MPFSGVRLGGALNPLSSPAAKQRGKKKSLASSAAADLFPDSLRASCGVLTPSGCVQAANPSRQRLYYEDTPAASSEAQWGKTKAYCPNQHRHNSEREENKYFPLILLGSQLGLEIKNR